MPVTPVPAPVPSEPTTDPQPAPTEAPPSETPAPDGPGESAKYPWHTGIVATTFWVGEIFDPNAADGSQMISTYDGGWYSTYGGCDGIVKQGSNGQSLCETEQRTADNDFFPTQMTPLENPFYLDLPFDDVNNATAAAMRADVIPWAKDPAYAGILADPSKSLMKNRWVVLTKGGNTCYGQIQDAGPGEYDDAAYVFGHNDERPKNARYGGAGMDVSPALNGCLGFAHINGDTDQVSWAFVDDADVPPGPWTRVITTSQVSW